MRLFGESEGRDRELEYATDKLGPLPTDPDYPDELRAGVTRGIFEVRDPVEDREETGKPMPPLETADVAIIGGGPAGSALGCYLSQAGVRNVILEKQRHPRPHVGESLVPSTTRVFREIGFLPAMERAGFIRKYGASWHSFRHGRQFDIWFKEFPQPGVGQDYTYHVDRGRFDQLLFEHARDRGSRVEEEAHVVDVLFAGGRAVGVRYLQDGEAREIHAPCVVDASGRSCVIGSRMKWKRKDPAFDQFAMHAWFEDVRRGRGPSADFIHIYFLPVERGWAWQIPITGSITSMGVVADRTVFRQSKGRKENWFQQMVLTNTALASALESARQVTPLRLEADYTYNMERFTGDGFLLVGDAARFVDPIFSSGVSVALQGARFASEAIVKALSAGDVEERLHNYERRLRSGVDIWYEFIVLYYRLMHLFTHFIQDPDYRMQLLQLLQGDVYDRGQVPVLDRMREIIQVVENTPGHVWKPYLAEV